MHVVGEVERGDGTGHEGGGDEGVNDEIKLVDSRGEDSWDGKENELLDVW